MTQGLIARASWWDCGEFGRPRVLRGETTGSWPCAVVLEREWDKQDHCGIEGVP